MANKKTAKCCVDVTYLSLVAVCLFLDFVNADDENDVIRVNAQSDGRHNDLAHGGYYYGPFEMTDGHKNSSPDESYRDNGSGNSSDSSDGGGKYDDHTGIMVVKAVVLVTIIGAAIVGNVLVIVSVFKFDKLRHTANVFIVSLAFADLLVAMLVMPFSASQEIAERWLFDETVCDVFNANDVLFCTASLLHLCCISMDRYIAITDPFGYEERMTRLRAAVTLGVVWAASTLLSHVPVHLEWNITQSHPNGFANGTCTFKVNRYYGVISSTISFWTPTIIMVFTYMKIYREARRQEKRIAGLTMLAGAGRRAAVGNGNGVSGSGDGTVLGGGGGEKTGGTTGSTLLVTAERNGSIVTADGFDDTQRLTNEGRKMKREHKAAKTLGIIMGAFLLCWLPFFTWYLTDSLCQSACDAPDVVISALFWIGYTNSALNPIIYACFNRDFRSAFKKLLGCEIRGSTYRQHYATTTTTTTTTTMTTTNERTCLKANIVELKNLKAIKYNVIGV